MTSVGRGGVLKAKWPAIVIALGVVAILVTTVVPRPGRGEDGPPWCLTCPAFSPRAGVDVFENVLLYVPLGLGLGLATVPAWIGLALGTALSGLIETLQVDIVSGRFATATDVVANAFGTLLGLIAGRYGPFLVLAPPRRSRWLAVAASLAMIATIGIASWAHQPTIDGTELIVTAPTLLSAAERRDESARLHGRVVGVVVDGRESSHGARLPADRLRQALADDPLHISVSFLPTTMREQHSPAVEIRDGHGRAIVTLREESRNVRLDLATRGDPLRLHRTFARAQRLLPSRAVRSRASDSGQLDTVHATATIGRRRLGIEARFGTAVASGDYRRGVDVGWSHIVRQHGSARRIALLSALWASLLAVPVGYWTARALDVGRSNDLREGRRIAAALGFLALTFAVAFVLVPAYTGSAPAPAWQWIAAGFGAALGGAVAFGVAHQLQRPRPNNRRYP